MERSSECQSYASQPILGASLFGISVSPTTVLVGAILGWAAGIARLVGRISRRGEDPWVKKLND